MMTKDVDILASQRENLVPGRKSQWLARQLEMFPSELEQFLSLFYTLKKNTANIMTRILIAKYS